MILAGEMVAMAKKKRNVFSVIWILGHFHLTFFFRIFGFASLVAAFFYFSGAASPGRTHKNIFRSSHVRLARKTFRDCLLDLFIIIGEMR